MIRVGIVEDELAVREALAELVDSAVDMEVVGAAEDALAAIAMVMDTRPDVVVLDVKIPQGGGPRAAAGILEGRPGTRVVGLSAYDDRSTVVAMLRAGAVGYIVKGASSLALLDGIRDAASGHAVLSKEVAGEVIGELLERVERSEGLAARLREIDRTKTQLVQVLSHELRTPTSVVQAFAELIATRRDAIPADRLAELSESVVRASARIGRVARNIEAAVAIGTDAVRRDARPITVSAIAAVLLDDFGWAANRIRLPSQEDLDRVRIWADPTLATRALGLVLENALELSSDDVEIELWSDSGEVGIQVCDRGPGVPEDFRPHLFEAFAQADMSETRPKEGIGIGLFLADRILVAHGGRIQYSERAGGGSVFTLVFPAPLGEADDPGDRTTHRREAAS